MFDDRYCTTDHTPDVQKNKSFTRSSKTCPLDQFSLLITNMVSDFAGDQYFCMIFLFKDHGPAIHIF